MWILRTLNDGEPEKTFRILAGGIRTIGRATGADCLFDDRLVSRVQCRVKALPTGRRAGGAATRHTGTRVHGAGGAVVWRVTEGRLERPGRVLLP